LQTVYPEHSSSFIAKRSQHGHWKTVFNQREFFDKLAKKWNINRPEDWYKVTTTMIFEEGGFFLRNYYQGSLIKALQAAYPEHEWKSYNRFLFGHTSEQRGSKSQASMFDILKKIIPNVPVHANYRIPIDEKHITSDQGLRTYEFDVSFDIWNSQL
jgi:hypothetical protein